MTLEAGGLETIVLPLREDDASRRAQRMLLTSGRALTSGSLKVKGPKLQRLVG